MAWVRGGDEAAMLEIVLAPAIEGDERLVNELYGFAARCAALAAAEGTYRIGFGKAFVVGTTRTRALIDMAVKYGYMAKVSGDGEPEAWELQQVRGLFHIKTKEEKDWENRRKRDNSNPKLTCPVRRRDGDNCRYCGREVDWVNRTGPLGATYDHVNGTPADSPDDLAVCCKECNEDPNSRPPLQPPPRRPVYGAKTKEHLKKYTKKYPSDPAPSGIPPTPERPRTQRDTANAESSQRPATAAENAANDTDVVRPPTDGDNAPEAVLRPPKPPPAGGGVRNLGSSGRDGPGREGMGGARSGSVVPGRLAPAVTSSGSGRKRSRRGASEGGSHG